MATAATMMQRDYNRDAALESIADAQADHGDLSGAIATARRIDDTTCLSDAKTHIAAAQIRAHLPSASETIAAKRKLAELIDDAPDDKCEAFCDIAALELSLGDLKAAKASLQHARLAADKIIETDERSPLWTRKWHGMSRIASELAEAGDFKAACATAAAFPQDYTNTELGDACRTIAMTEVRSGDLPGTEQWVSSIKSDFDRAYAWVGIAQAVATHAPPR
jgi:hypothetical protein